MGFVIFDDKAYKISSQIVRNASVKENRIFYIPMFYLSGGVTT